MLRSRLSPILSAVLVHLSNSSSSDISPSSTHSQLCSFSIAQYLQPAGHVDEHVDQDSRVDPESEPDYPEIEHNLPVTARDYDLYPLLHGNRNLCDTLEAVDQAKLQAMEDARQLHMKLMKQRQNQHRRREKKKHERDQWQLHHSKAHPPSPAATQDMDLDITASAATDSEHGQQGHQDMEMCMDAPDGTEQSRALDVTGATFLSPPNPQPTPRDVDPPAQRDQKVGIARRLVGPEPLQSRVPSFHQSTTVQSSARPQDEREGAIKVAETGNRESSGVVEEQNSNSTDQQQHAQHIRMGVYLEDRPGSVASLDNIAPDMIRLVADQYHSLQAKAPEALPGTSWDSIMSSKTGIVQRVGKRGCSWPDGKDSQACK